MAETKAEDDDDEGFGDFTFASFSNYSNQIKSHKDPTFTFTTTEDDEWGDFLEYPPPKADPFVGFIDQSKLGYKKEESFGVKRGALPLSLFGDDVEEEEKEKSSVVDSLGGGDDFSIVNYTGGSVNNVKKEKNYYLGVGINDIVANLYNQKPQIKVDNNGFISNLNGFHLNQSNLNLNIGSENGLSNSSQLVSISSLNLGGINELDSSVNRVSGDDEFDGEDEGWEFMDASSEAKVVNGSDKGNVVSGIPEVEGQSFLKLGREMQELPDIAMLSSGLGNGRSVDLFPVTNGFPLESYKMDGLLDFKPSTTQQNGFITDSFSQPDSKDKENFSKSNTIAGVDDPDEYFGDFEAAFPGPGSHEKVQESPMFSTGLQNSSNGPSDLFSTLSDYSNKSYEVDVGVDLKHNTVEKNGSFSYSYSETTWENGENRLNLDPVAGSADSDENFGEFETAFPDAGLNQKGNETRSENHKGAVPLSIFGIEEPEADESLDIQHSFIHEPPATFTRNVQKQNSTLSINDILSDLYSQAEAVPSLDSKGKTTDVGLDSTAGMLSSNSLEDDDNFDDFSWEFKDAVPQSSSDAPKPNSYHDDSNQNFYAHTEQNEYVDFYCKLKDDLCSVARYHLDNIKKAQSIDANSGEDAKVAAIDEEIQEACHELHEENIISKEARSYDQPPEEVSLKKHLKVLHELKFQALDSEYHLSRRLSLAESDLKSAIELIKHIKTMLKILTLVPVKAQSDYVHLWSKMISVCAQELKHGSRIWAQAVEKNVQIQLLSNPQGKRYFLALGEIYRVVVTLGASVKFYKPWVLSTSVDSAGLYALLEECHTMWSTSGLEEALQNISDSGPEYKDNIQSLFDSIKNVCDLNMDEMANSLSIEQGYSCRLSFLTPAVVPGLKLVNWDGKNYFLTLANLWANLVSSDPPTLSFLQVG